MEQIRTWMLLVAYLIVESFSADLVVSIDSPVTLPSPLHYMWVDYNGTFWVSLSSQQFRRYSDNMTELQIIPLGFMPSQTQLLNISISITLDNGTQFTMSQQAWIGITYSSYNVELYQFPSNTWISCHDTNPNTIKTYYAQPFTTHTSTKVYFVTILHNRIDLNYQGIHDISPSIMPGNILQGQFIKVTHLNNGDTLIVGLQFIVSTDQPAIYHADIHLTFTYNHPCFYFDYSSFTTTMTQLSPSIGTISLMNKAEDLIIMEDAAASICYLYCISTQTLTQQSHPTSQTTHQLVYLHGQYYVLHSNGLVKMQYHISTNTLHYDYLTSSLPTGDYRLAIGSTATYLYELNSPIIHHSLTPENSLSTQNQHNFYIRLIDILSATISNPLGRRVVGPLFYFFGIFDDLFLYQFHDRQYGKTMKTVFFHINAIEEAKWSLLSFQVVFDLFGANTTSYKELTQYQDSYTTYDFSCQTTLEPTPEGLMANSHNFFIVAIPVTFALFVFCRFFFKVSFNKRVSLIVRKFDFWAFLLILLFDGNVQQFAFHMVAEWQNVFFFTISQKVLKLTILLFGFVLVMSSVIFYLFCFSQYGKLNRKIMDNNANSLRGTLLLTAQIWFRNYMLGVLNSLLRFLPYEQMLAFITALDFFFLCLFVVSIRYTIYDSKLKMWIYVLLNYLRIVLSLTLFWDYNNVNLPIVEGVQQFLVWAQVVVFLSGIFTQTIVWLNELGSMIKKVFPKDEDTENLRPKSKAGFTDEQKIILEYNDPVNTPKVQTQSSRQNKHRGNGNCRSDSRGKQQHLRPYNKSHFHNGRLRKVPGQVTSGERQKNRPQNEQRIKIDWTEFGWKQNSRQKHAKNTSKGILISKYRQTPSKKERKQLHLRIYQQQCNLQESCCTFQSKENEKKPQKNRAGTSGEKKKRR